MKKYRILVRDGNGCSRTFYSHSRNAKQHLGNEYGGQFGARCIVYDRNDNILSMCEFTAENGGKYIYLCH